MEGEGDWWKDGTILKHPFQELVLKSEPKKECQPEHEHLNTENHSDLSFSTASEGKTY